MNEIIGLIVNNGLLNEGQEQLNARKEASLQDGNHLIGSADAGIYVRSLYRMGDLLYCMARTGEAKRLVVCGTGVQASSFPFDVSADEDQGVVYQAVPLEARHAKVLQELFPFTKPRSLRQERTTIGMGDRLGRATAGQLRAARKYPVAPVLAQQSIRELEFTGRSFADVVADASFMVFEEGFERGFGADGDHLKTIEDMDTALAEHMPMITLDLTNVLKPEAADWSADEVQRAFAKLDASFRERVEREYADQRFELSDGAELTVGETEAERCAVMYGEALDFAETVNAHLKEQTGDRYDLEVSIDETTTPTLPEHHLFIARELYERGVTVSSLAPRFIGDFQKAVDYIGELSEFEEQFETHCRIARAFGDYKISVHSGSDKFAVYPAVGRHTRGRFHLKTSGTSWLESLRVVAERRPELYRLIHRKAFEYFPEALKKYHITADVEAIPALDNLGDAELPRLLDDPNCRQLLHISYGGLLNDTEVREPLFRTLHEEEAAYYDALERHFDKHLGLLLES
jgi:hypothetical protein